MDFFQKLGVRFDQHSQSILLAFLFFVGGVGLILGGMNLRSSLRNPFIEKGVGALQTAEGTTALVDTDGDGLTDEEELAQYGTSPYLADSDSDGANDADELAASSDPNCPTGKNCQAVAELDVPSSAGDTFSSLLQVSANGTTEPSAAQIRAALLTSGVAESELAKLTDEEIVAGYRSAVQAQTSTTASDGVQNLSTEEIRKVLKEQGVTDEQLSKISDTELLKLYEETLRQTQP
ncbi:MAG: hypothetical protein WC052_00490 [Patescibacteria group bacterium]